MNRPFGNWLKEHLGERYLLKIIEREAAPKVELDHKYIHLYVRPNTNTAKRAEIISGLVPHTIKTYRTYFN